MELSIGGFKRAFKPFRLRLNLRPYNKLDKKVKTLESNKMYRHTLSVRNGSNIAR